MYNAVVKRTSISLPNELALTLDREARRRGVSISEVARNALAAHFELDGSGPRAVPFAGVVDLDEVPWGSEIDTALRTSWAAEVERDR